MTNMNDGEYVDPFDMPDEVVSSTLETRHKLTPYQNELIEWLCARPLGGIGREYREWYDSMPSGVRKLVDEKSS